MLSDAIIDRNVHLSALVLSAKLTRAGGGAAWRASAQASWLAADAPVKVSTTIL